MDSGGHGHKKEVDPKKNTCFVIEKYFEDVKQDEKSVPDLVERIVQPTDPVKEELQRIWSTMSRFRP